MIYIVSAGYSFLYESGIAVVTCVGLVLFVCMKDEPRIISVV